MKILSALLAAFLLVATPLVADQPQIMQSVRGLAWGGENHCTTSSINEKASLWITAAHCVDNPQEFMIDGFEARVVAFDPGTDLAIMVSPGHKTKAIEFADEAPTYGDEISVWGHPLGLEQVVFFRGHIAAPEIVVVFYDEHTGLSETWKFALFNLSGAPGNSGSPILNKDGELVSILQIGFSNGTFGSVTGGATYADLKAFVSEYLP